MLLRRHPPRQPDASPADREHPDGVKASAADHAASPLAPCSLILVELEDAAES